MFQYTNTILLNTLVDEASGLAKIKDITNGIHILRVNPFLKANVCALYKRKAQDAIVGKVDITLTGSATDRYRIKLYARLSGSQNSYYANDFVFKGKPFVYEFAGSTDAVSVAKIINKINNIYGDKFLKITGSGSVITFTGDEYINFTEAKLQKYTEGTEAWKEGTWDDVTTTVAITPCFNGFGTYAQVIKDLRLPTMENRRWEGINKEELPIVGAKYDEYIIEYAVDRGIMGGDALGQLVKSKTTHVFYVNQTISEDFETEIKKLETSGSVTLQTITKPIEVSVSGSVSAIAATANSTTTISVTAADSVTISSITATSSESWATISATTASSVTVKATANTATTDRKAVITIVAKAASGALSTITQTVTQSGTV